MEEGRFEDARAVVCAADGFRARARLAGEPAHVIELARGEIAGVREQQLV